MLWLSFKACQEQEEKDSNLCLDFFAAGSETTSTTLVWSVMYMALYPEVQEKCQKEIDEYLQGTKYSHLLTIIR